jgi:hypothetical protein
MRNAGLPAVPAKKTVGEASDPSSGIGLVHALLSKRMEDGSPFCMYSPKLRNYRREMENYVRDDGNAMRNPNEKPRKLDDHLMDAERYVEMGIARIWDNGGVMVPHYAELRLSA